MKIYYTIINDPEDPIASTALIYKNKPVHGAIVPFVLDLVEKSEYDKLVKAHDDMVETSKAFQKTFSEIEPEMTRLNEKIESLIQQNTHLQKQLGMLKP